MQTFPQTFISFFRNLPYNVHGVLEIFRNLLFFYAGNVSPAVIHGDQHHLCLAGRNCHGNSRADFPVQGVGHDDRALAMMIPAGPMITSASAALNKIAFSPVAAKDGPPFSMVSVAMEFVPVAPTSASGKFLTSNSTKERPIPPPCPSITRIRMIIFSKLLELS